MYPYISIDRLTHLVPHDEERLAQPLHLQDDGLEARDHVQVGFPAVF